MRPILLTWSHDPKPLWIFNAQNEIQIVTTKLKKLILLTLILKTTFGLAQEAYKFDYAIETEVTYFKEDSIKKKVLYLTNSKNNSYFAQITSNDSLHYKLIFRHHDKLYSKVLVSKSQLNIAEFININCESILYEKNKNKRAVERYDFFLLKDTIVKDISHKAYEFKSILNLKKRIRKGAVTSLFIIDNTTSFHLPLLTHPTAYEDWKLNSKLPNGLFIEKKHIDVYNIEHSSEKLIAYTQIDKSIIITGGCDD
ncbi:hypothetical protein LRR18_05085 [Mangrovimonas sp. AS39]|uniref:hypothetical protein n=1 Tax=Mangrovimonas TaxID=1211036 RepID=UPI00141D8A37|nr:MULTISPECIES: hypothetical protein [Mangrovimonas]MCF1190951.1 hypothetical protein [Mangrovimonas futianensis]MCF1194647.1 hypothetical protein [Mangrovimonas futianensis]NIK91507.1 hypothetical protein [Mangrovimonas sp. CR14]